MFMWEDEERFVVIGFDESRVEGDGIWIRQAYYGYVRIRVTSHGKAYLTVKSRSEKKREKFQFEIPFFYGLSAFFVSRAKYMLEKIRYKIDGWDVDIFQGDKLGGLVVAELERQSASCFDDITFPREFKGSNRVRVTGNAWFRNHRLARAKRIPQLDSPPVAV